MGKYREITFSNGSLEQAVNELKSHEDLVKGTFNGVLLYSDFDDMDLAYLKVTGKTKAEFDSKKKRAINLVNLQ